MATRRVVTLDQGKLGTVKITSLGVYTRASGTWLATKATTSLTLVGTNVVVVDAGWYVVTKNGAAPDMLNLGAAATIPLSGTNGTVYNITGPWS